MAKRGRPINYEAKLPPVIAKQTDRDDTDRLTVHPDDLATQISTHELEVAVDAQIKAGQIEEILRSRGTQSGQTRIKPRRNAELALKALRGDKKMVELAQKHNISKERARQIRETEAEITRNKFKARQNSIDSPTTGMSSLNFPLESPDNAIASSELKQEAVRQIIDEIIFMRANPNSLQPANKMRDYEVALEWMQEKEIADIVEQHNITPKTAKTISQTVVKQVLSRPPQQPHNIPKTKVHYPQSTEIQSTQPRPTVTLTPQEAMDRLDKQKKQAKQVRQQKSTSPGKPDNWTIEIGSSKTTKVPNTKQKPTTIGSTTHVQPVILDPQPLPPPNPSPSSPKDNKTPTSPIKRLLNKWLKRK